MADPDARQRMVAALCAPELASIVDLVLWVEDDEPYAANHLGTVRFRYGGPAELVSGTNPIGSEDPLPPESEARLGAFCELVSLAVASAQARADLRASRARVVECAL